MSSSFLRVPLNKKTHLLSYFSISILPSEILSSSYSFVLVQILTSINVFHSSLRASCTDDALNPIMIHAYYRTMWVYDHHPSHSLSVFLSHPVLSSAGNYILKKVFVLRLLPV
ncbi:unnamed protein product [Adineta ricciae]|uniref:Uncharacterized protein n=1 Tax=Adineta ricciae TaxID=249248 RepID=A0A814AQD0_ADIRI|nr:unnamed protein product [Adineta ricciae]